jgi:hypothetical protein
MFPLSIRQVLPYLSDRVSFPAFPSERRFNVLPKSLQEIKNALFRLNRIRIQHYGHADLNPASDPIQGFDDRKI